MSPAGASWGTLRDPEALLRAARRLQQAGCTAIAVAASACGKSRPSLPPPHPGCARQRTGGSKARDRIAGARVASPWSPGMVPSGCRSHERCGSATRSAICPVAWPTTASARAWVFIQPLRPGSPCARLARAPPLPCAARCRRRRRRRRSAARRHASQPRPFQLAPPYDRTPSRSPASSTHPFQVAPLTLPLFRWPASRMTRTRRCSLPTVRAAALTAWAARRLSSRTLSPG